MYLENTASSSFFNLAELFFFILNFPSLSIISIVPLLPILFLAFTFTIKTSGFWRELYSVNYIATTNTGEFNLCCGDIVSSWIIFILITVGTPCPVPFSVVFIADC